MRSTSALTSDDEQTQHILVLMAMIDVVKQMKTAKKVVVIEV